MTQTFFSLPGDTMTKHYPEAHQRQNGDRVFISLLTQKGTRWARVCVSVCGIMCDIYIYIYFGLHTALSETQLWVRWGSVQLPGYAGLRINSWRILRQTQKRGDVRCARRIIIIQPEDWKLFYSTAAVWLINESIFWLHYWIKGHYLLFAETPSLANTSWKKLRKLCPSSWEGMES